MGANVLRRLLAGTRVRVRPYKITRELDERGKGQGERVKETKGKRQRGKGKGENCEVCDKLHFVDCVAQAGSLCPAQLQAGSL